MTDLALVLAHLALLAGPLVALAWGLKVYPRRPLICAALVPGVLSLVLLGPALGGWPDWITTATLYLTGAFDVVLVLVALADLAALPRKDRLSVQRDSGRIASLAKPHAVRLTVCNHGRRALRACLRDGVPDELCPQPDEFFERLPPRARSVFSYRLRPARRGAFSIGEVHARVVSPLGLWQRLLRYPAVTRIDVYPDMKQLSQYAVLARTNRLSLVGVRRTRRVGQDNEFERLRDYGLDDNYKHIDWRASARRRKLTVRDYQATQSQRLVFLLDCGRMMTNLSAGLSLLDHGLNATLMLSYVALRQGDAVGMITFSDEIHGFLPPRGGMYQMNRLLHAAFDRFPQLVESRYDLAFRYLAAHCRKRSLVVLITNVVDEVNAHQIESYLANLVGRHLPLGVLLRDRRMFEALEVEHPPEELLWRAAATADILCWRHQVLTDLQRKGVLALDVFPEEMTAPLVNRYLEIKARHLL